MFRDIKSIAKSLRARDKIPYKQGKKFATEYMQRMLDLTVEFPDVPLISIKYEHVIENPQKQIARLAKFVGLQGEVPEDFVDPSLKHH